MEIKRRLGLMAQDYVDFTNDILQKYSFFKDGSFVKLFIKRIKVNYARSDLKKQFISILVHFLEIFELCM